MTDRLCGIRLLIGSRFDGWPVPGSALSSPSGLVPASLEPCPGCGGLGRVVDRFGRPGECRRCDGRGRLAFDPMDALHVPVGADETSASARPRRTVRCDGCEGAGAFSNGRRCPHCDGAGRVDEHRFELVVSDEDERELEDVFDRWQDALDRRRKSGSYEDLDAALAGLIHHVNKPVQWRWLTGRAVEAIRLLDELWLHRARLLDDLTAQELVLVTAAEAYIEARMPDPIRVPKGVRDNDEEHREHRLRVKGRSAANGAVVKRDAEIRGLVRRGVPTQRVAFDYGLSVSQVNRIVAGRAEDAA